MKTYGNMASHPAKPEAETLDEFRDRLAKSRRERVVFPGGMGDDWAVDFDTPLCATPGHPGLEPCRHAKDVATRVYGEDYLVSPGSGRWLTTKSWTVPRVLIGSSGLGGEDYDGYACLDCVIEGVAGIPVA